MGTESRAVGRALSASLGLDSAKGSASHAVGEANDSREYSGTPMRKAASNA